MADASEDAPLPCESYPPSYAPTDAAEEEGDAGDAPTPKFNSEQPGAAPPPPAPPRARKSASHRPRTRSVTTTAAEARGAALDRRRASVAPAGAKARPSLVAPPPTPQGDAAAAEPAVVLHDVMLEAAHDGGARGRAHYLLRRVTAALPRCGLCAIMGPSGAGKTTLLNVMAGRIKPTRGTCHVAGGVGYVMQDARFVPWLTVRETLHFGARCYGVADPAAAVDDALRRTGLAVCADTLVGGSGVRGVSGGQRRRVLVALELLRSRDVLLCDEPTSGLDTNNADVIIDTLQGVAEGRGGGTPRCVVCTIHQPSTKVLTRFTHCLLLVGGEVAYCGPANCAVRHFESAGRPFPPFTNPANWWLSLLSGDADADGGGDEPAGFGAIRNVEQQQLQRRRIDALLTAWGGVAPPPPAPPADASPPDAVAVSGATGLAQVAMLLSTNFCAARRDRGALIAGIGKCAADCVFCLMFYPQLGTSPGDVESLIAFISLLPIQQHLEACARCSTPLLAQRAITVREHQSGMYSLTAWWLANTVSNTVSQVLWTTALISISYQIVGMREGAAPFLQTLLAMVLLILMSQAFAVAVASGCREQGLKRVHIMLFALSFPFILSNYGIRPAASPIFLRPIFEASPFRHCFDAVAIAQFRGRQLDPCGNSTVCLSTGDEVLSAWDVGATPLHQPYLCLAAWVVALRGVALARFTLSVREEIRSNEAIGA